LYRAQNVPIDSISSFLLKNGFALIGLLDIIKLGLKDVIWANFGIFLDFLFYFGFYVNFLYAFGF
jgi:hypothetical protein